MGYSVCMITSDETGMRVLFEDIPDVEGANALAQHCLRTRGRDKGIVFIAPPFQKEYDEDGTKKLIEEYRSDGDGKVHTFMGVERYKQALQDVRKAFDVLAKLG